jgi:hypothetical protein
LKHYVGVEGDITIYTDMKPIKEQGISGVDDIKVSVNFEGALSLGFSTQLKGAVVAGSTEGNIDDQIGVNLVILDQYSTNLAGCAPQFAMCGGLETTFDKNLSKPISKGVLFGFGEGYDISVDLFTISDAIFEGSKGKFKVQIPIANERFIKRVNTTFRSLQKLLAE